MLQGPRGGQVVRYVPTEYFTIRHTEVERVCHVARVCHALHTVFVHARSRSKTQLQDTKAREARGWTQWRGRGRGGEGARTRRGRCPRGHPCRPFRGQPLRRFAGGCDALGGQVSPDESALRACTSLSFGHSARVCAGSSATSITPRPRKKQGEKCWRRLRWRRTQSRLGSPTMTKRPSIAAACAAPRLRPLREPTDGAWLGLGPC